MVADTSDQFHHIRQLDQVIARAQREGIAFSFWVFLGRQHDDRNVCRICALAILLQQLHTVRPRHDQILQNHGRLDPGDHLKYVDRVRAVMKVNIRMRHQHAPDRFPYHRLVVYQQHRNRMFARKFIQHRLCIADAVLDVITVARCLHMS